MGYPSWQFLAFLCLGEKLPRWTYLARNCWHLSSSARLTWVEFCAWKFLSFPLSGCKLLRWSFLGGSSLQCSCSFLEFPFWNLRVLLASLFLQRNFLGGVSGWGILAGNSFLFLCWGKNCLGGITWLEIAGVFLHRPDSPGWSFVGGNSLLSCRWSAGYLGGVSWMEVPFAVLLPRIPFLEFNEVAGFPLSAEKFHRWSFLGGTSWLAILSFLCFGNQILGGIFWVEVPFSAPAPSWNSLFGI